MTETLSTTVSILTAVGFGSILGAYFQALFQQRAKVVEHEHELKRTRYMCILILMLTKLNPNIGLERVRNIRPDLRTLDDIESELQTELLNAVIFAKQPVLEAISTFVRSPSQFTFIKATTEMRKDLWGKKAKVNSDLIDFLLSQ
ncbi:MAG: hypothetical protein AAF329_12425 [Cyanobacteria bacterium P01_A01_bin.17]